MHKNEDLIAALADGSLDSERIPEAEAMVASDPEAAALLDAHRRTLHAVHAAPTPMMTLAERSRVRSAVAETLGMGEPADAVAAQSRGARWTSLAIGAGALAAFLAFVPLAGMLTPGGMGQTAFDHAALRLAEREGEAGPAEMDATDSVLSFGGDQSSDGDLAPGGDQTPGGTVVVEPPPAEAETSTTSAPTTTTNVTVDETPGPDETDLSDALAMLDGEVDDLAALLEDAVVTEADTECGAEARAVLHHDRNGDADDAVVFGFSVTARDGRELMVFFERDPEGRVWNLVVLRADDCEVVAPPP